MSEKTLLEICRDFIAASDAVMSDASHAAGLRFYEAEKAMREAVAAAPAQTEPSVYVATLKSKAQIKAEIPREAQGWWADVCPGETLELRDATAADVARCCITEGQSRDPADYLCELPARGALVARIAIASIKAKTRNRAYVK